MVSIVNVQLLINNLLCIKDDDFVTRKAQTAHTTPTGSLVSVVCGTAANDTDSVPDPNSATLLAKKEKTASYLKVEPRKKRE